jgi:hypothetical protein
MVYHMMYLLETVSHIHLHYLIDILIYGLLIDVFINIKIIYKLKIKTQNLL